MVFASSMLCFRLAPLAMLILTFCDKQQQLILTHYQKNPRTFRLRSKSCVRSSHQQKSGRGHSDEDMIREAHLLRVKFLLNILVWRLEIYIVFESHTIARGARA